MIVEVQERDLQEQSYVLSSQELSAWDLLPQLKGIGIARLKIEGA